MRNHALRLCLAVSFAALLVGCDSVPVKSTAPDVSLQAERDFDEGRFAEAAQGFLDAAASQRSRRDWYKLRAAEAWREEGFPDRAADALDGISSKKFDSDARTRLGLLQAELALHNDQPAQALSLLDRIGPQLAHAYLPRYHESRARAAAMLGDAFTAAAERALLGDFLSKREKVGNDAQIRQLLDGLDDDRLAAGAAAVAAEHPVYPFAARALMVRRLPLPHPLPRVALFDDVAPMEADGYRALRRVALLLPKDGALAAAGNAVREGFFAGYFDEQRAKPDLVIYDSGNDSATALESWRTARAEGAQLIVGPLGRDQVSALFEQDDGAVPTLALNRGGTMPPPAGSAGFALMIEDEAAAAAERIAQRGFLRVLAIHGGDEQGQRASAALAERLKQLGGEVAATATLPADSPNFGPVLQQALRDLGAGFEPPSEPTDPNAPPVERRLNLNADAIFLVARSDQARLLMPQLALAGIQGVPIYATSMIASGSGNPRLDRELDGIEFTEATWLVDNVPDLPRREQLEGLDSARGAAARLFAFGLDAFRIASHYEWLSANPANTLAGATGELRMDGIGNVQRRPGWARFSGGRILPAAEPALIGDSLQFTSP